MAAIKFVCALVACMLVTAMANDVKAAHAAADTPVVHASACNLLPCVDSISKGALLTEKAVCCKAVKAVYLAANTTVERKKACNCLKQVAVSTQAVGPYLAAAIPGKCGLNVTYTISASTDCDLVV